MKRMLLLLCAALLATGLAWSAARADGDDGSSALLVTLRAGVDGAAFAAEYGALSATQISGSRTYRLEFDEDVDIAAVLAAMRRDSRVRSADRDRGAETPEANPWVYIFDGDRGPEEYQGQYAIPQVHFSRAARLSRGKGVTVAILDTGISLRHPALASRVLPGWNFVDDTPDTDDAPVGLDVDLDGLKDEAAGHGTFIAGLVTRFAPKARLLPVKVLNSEGRGELWAAVRGVRYAIKRGAKVLNLSFGVPESAGALAAALDEARKRGVVVVASAGNHNTDEEQFPAHYSHVVAVAGLNPDNTKAEFSNYGSDVDVCAPAVEIVSTYWDGRYVAWSGTSFSSAIVSAEAALIFSRAPNLRADRVIRAIIRTSHSVDRWNPEYRGELGESGSGLVDFDAALKSVR